MQCKRGTGRPQHATTRVIVVAFFLYFKARNGFDGGKARQSCTNCLLIKQFFTLDLSVLRTAVSTISSKCMGYAKLLWLKEGDFKKSKKNVFHSIRYVVFGIQIATFGKVGTS
jgi:hypothetical protein